MMILTLSFNFIICLPTSLPLRPFSASFLLLSTSHCYEIPINSAVPGVNLITSSGWPKSFGCYYSIPLPSLSFHSGTRQTPTTVPHLLVPLHCTIPGALHLPSPPLPLHAAPACHLSALVFALFPSLSPKLWSLKRFLRDPGITGPPGELLPYWDQIPYTRFLFDFW